jgi:glycosyltransferase involved in cell wall biosynthesis
MVTAVIPCYNAAAWLRTAIESVLHQTRPVAEAIVVDDGSTDASCAIASEYPVRLLRTATNRGLPHVRNVGLRAASHDLVAWLDADDYWDRQHCAVVVPLLERHAEAAVAFSAVREVGDRTGVWTRPSACDGPTSVFWDCFDATIVPAMSVVTRRQAALAVGGFREEIRVAADFEFWLRMSAKHPFVWTREVTANYRRHPRQISAHPLAQSLSTHRSRVLAAAERQDEGDLDVACRMRDRARDLFDADLGDAWWRADMPRVRALLALAQTQELATPTTRKLRRLAWMPSTAARGWRAFRRVRARGR